MTVSAASSFLPNANIVKIHGLAFINKEQVEVGTEVGKGMEIKIPKKGDYVIIKFQNGHKLALLGATVKVEDLNEKTSVMNLTKGEAHASVKSLTEGEKFIINTKYADFSVQGTRFGVSILDRKKKAYLYVQEGVVTAAQNNHSVEVSANEELWVSMNAEKLISSKSKVLFSKKTKQMFTDMSKL